MSNKIERLFDNKGFVKKIKTKLPYLFQLANLEFPGMEVGSVREKIIIALLMLKFDKKNVKETKANHPEQDVMVYRTPISIKTTSSGGIKLKWTTDANQVKKFKKDYSPSCDMIYVRINWSKEGGFYYIPKKVQTDTLRSIGSKAYIKSPTQGTNSRGIEITSAAMKQLINNRSTRCISIDWPEKKNIKSNPYTRWMDLWKRLTK